MNNYQYTRIILSISHGFPLSWQTLDIIHMPKYDINSSFSKPELNVIFR